MLVLSLVFGVFGCAKKEEKKHKDRHESRTTIPHESKADREPTNSPTPSPTNTPTPTATPTATPVPFAHRNEYNGEYGNAGTIDGRTVIVSIFVNDAGTSWDGVSMREREEYAEQLVYACDWLEAQVARYDEESEFVCDWREHEDLYMEAEFTVSLVTMTSEHFADQKNYIINNIDADYYKDKYDCEDIIYMFFFNTPDNDDVRSWTINYEPGYNNKCEFINIYNYEGEYFIRPSAMAHEIMHCFGAHDFYYSSDFVPQEYIDHLEEIGSEDIMYIAYNMYEIVLEFSDVDAYYVGLIDSCDEVEEWGLGVADWDEDNY